MTSSFAAAQPVTIDDVRQAAARIGDLPFTMLRQRPVDLVQ
jgi:hypothetical protein